MSKEVINMIDRKIVLEELVKSKLENDERIEKLCAQIKSLRVKLGIDTE